MAEGDTRGASEDAREVDRSSPALRPQAKAILRTVEAHGMQQPIDEFFNGVAIDDRSEAIPAG